MFYPDENIDLFSSFKKILFEICFSILALFLSFLGAMFRYAAILNNQFCIFGFNYCTFLLLSVFS